MDRLEEIKERIQRGQELYPDDPKVLLERIEHLQKENKRLYEALSTTTGRIAAQSQAKRR